MLRFTMFEINKNKKSTKHYLTEGYDCEIV